MPCEHEYEGGYEIDRCPHPPEDDGDCCLFHLPPEEKDDDDVVRQFIECATEDGRSSKQFAEARFGDLNLDYAVLSADDNFPVDLRGIHVTGDFTVDRSAVHQPVQLADARFDGDVVIDNSSFTNEIDLSRAVFKERAVFTDTVFEQRAVFEGMIYSGDAADGAIFENVIFRGTADFRGATFAGVAFRDVTFENRSTFWNATFEADGTSYATSFTNSTFAEVDMSAASFEGPADFSETKIRIRIDFQNAKFGKLDFTDATLGLARFNDAIFGKTYFINTTFRDDASFARSYNETRFEDAVQFTDATFLGDASFAGVQFDDMADFSGAGFDGHADFSGALLADSLTLTGASFDGEVEFRGTSFGSETDFGNAAFAETVSFESNGEATRFDAPVSFERTVFGSDVNLTSVVFEGPVRFQETRFDGRAEFSDVEFRCDAKIVRTPESTFFGGVVFTNATFGGDVVFRGSVFHSRVIFRDVQFGGRVNYNEAVFGGTAAFTAVTFDERLSFVDATFDSDDTTDDIIEFGGTTFHDDVEFIRTEFTDALSIVDGRIEGTALFDAVRLEDTVFVLDSKIEVLELVRPERDGPGQMVVDLRGTDLTRGMLGQSQTDPVIYDLTDARLGDVDLESLGAPGALFEHYFIYMTDFDGFDFSEYEQALAESNWVIHTTIDSEGNGVRQASDWLASRSIAGSSGSQLNRNLHPAEVEATYLKAKNGAADAGNNKTAAEFFRLEMTYRRHKHATVALNGDADLHTRFGATYRWAANKVLQISSGYGERPSLVVLSSLSLILGFAVVYGTLLQPPVPPGYIGENYVLFSFQSFITFILGSPQSGPSFWVQALAAIEGFLGAFLIALFVFTLTRAIHR